MNMLLDKVLNIHKWCGYWSTEHVDYVICANGLGRYVVLPRGTDNAVLVFSETRKRSSFRIEREDISLWSEQHYFKYTLEGVASPFLFGFKQELEFRYEQGYRYVRVEYND